LSLLICVPIHGFGQTPFWLSILKLQETLITAKFEHDFLVIENESLIQRARNNAVTTFLETDFERLLFIDSDIEFTPEDVSKLWNMNCDVAVGCYPMKRLDTPTTAWKDGSLVDLDQLEGITEIDYAGTGFMMIHRQVFDDFRLEFPNRGHREGKPSDNVHDSRESFNYFDTRVDGGVFLSEDYCFCQDFREMGGKILLDPSIKLTHWGSFGF